VNERIEGKQTRKSFERVGENSKKSEGEKERRRDLDFGDFGGLFFSKNF